MTTFKLSAKQAREWIAAQIQAAPWYARDKLAELVDAPLGIRVTVEKVKRKRSNEANAYYWLCLGILAKAIGMTPDEAHEAVLCEHHGSNEVRIGKRVHHVPKGRSHDLNTGEFSALIETLHRVAAFCGCTLPEPEAVV